MNKKTIVAVILWIILLIIPLNYEIAHIVPYYLIVGLSFFVWCYRQWNAAKLDENFCRRWGRSRERGMLINIILTSIINLLLVLIVTGLIQYIANGHTPIEILNQLPDGMMLWLSLIALIICVIGSIASWYEKEKKYDDACD